MTLKLKEKNPKNVRFKRKNEKIRCNADNELICRRVSCLLIKIKTLIRALHYNEKKSDNCESRNTQFREKVGNKKLVKNVQKTNRGKI